MKDRFAKLAALTRGAALLGAGLGAAGALAACTNEPSGQPPVASAGAAAPASEPVAQDGGRPPYRARLPAPNAVRRLDDTLVPDGGPQGAP